MILVFGKNGQIGREFEKFKNIITVSRDQADLINPEACIRLIYDIMPSAVINAAAYTAVDLAETEEDLATQINGNTPGLMAEACKDLNIPFIFISTDYIFDGSGNVPWATDDMPNPQNAYGRSKLIGENAVILSKSIYAIIRTSWVISSYGSNFLKTMLRLSSIKDSVDVVSDQVGGPTPAFHIAEACVLIVQALKSKPEKSGIYHFSGFPDVCWCDFANAIFKENESLTKAFPILSIQRPTQAKRPLNSRLDCSKLLDTFTIKRPDWRQELKTLISNVDIA